MKEIWKSVSDKNKNLNSTITNNALRLMYVMNNRDDDDHRDKWQRRQQLTYRA